MFKSEIRDSDLYALGERVRKGAYDKYLNKMTLVRLRGFREREITFDFPVTALVGPNGAGKTTVLGAAALIYGVVKPRTFFAKSGRYDDSMQNWRVEYDLLDRSLQRNTSISRTASYLRAKWNRDAVQREVVILGVTRTLPASERKDLARCISGDFKGVTEKFFDPSVVDAVEKILGKEASNYMKVDADRAGKISIYAARARNADKGDDSYSEFHFGAGEASVIRIVSQVEAAAPQALILIEEIENGLHPVATRRLVEYLIEVAKRKSCQVIFTTHSNDALAPLPTNAVWSAYQGNLTQGKLDVAALRTLTGQVEARLAIFTEDHFDELVADVTLRTFGKSRNLDRSGIAIHGLGGAATARDHMRYHNENPTRTFHAICLLDGDKRKQDDYEANHLSIGGSDGSPNVGNDIVYLAGDSDPEEHIFDTVANNLDHISTLTAKLTLALTLDTPDQERVREVVLSRLRINRDRHVIFEQIGEDLGFLSTSVVERAFVTAWANAFPHEIAAIWEPCEDLLPQEDT